MFRSLLSFAAHAVLLSVMARAQVLAPAVSTTIDVDATFGHLSYASISIPAGVVVRFVGNHPVRIRVLGDVRIDGEISVAHAGNILSGVVGGPGAVSTGIGWSGFITHYSGYYDPFTQQWMSGYSIGTAGQPARHASLYGSPLPFDLAGGSPGGDCTTTYVQRSTGTPHYQTSHEHGGRGGGTLTLEANGRIDVYGAVTADAGSGGSSAGAGSGGSILLRGLRGCRVVAGASVTAMPEGIIRLDAYDTPPQIAGTVLPAPMVLRLPDLRETLPPVVGSIWQVRVAAPRGDTVFLAVSFQPGSGTTAYGAVGIDLASAITFAVVTLSVTGHDPLATFDLAVPNVPQLAGLNMWVQGLDWFTSLPPRYTQVLATSVR
jgi:hypothetical protein